MEVVAKFARLMGADYFRVGLPGGYLVGNADADLRRLFATMTDPLGPVPAMMPACSGGLKPANLGGALAMFGDRAMYLAGTGITKHPGGVAAGVLALQQAGEAFHQNVPVQEFAKTHPALKDGLTI
jgi:ribulose-bisphosphate carboxylase large chain